MTVPTDREVLSVEEAGRILGLGRSSAYKAHRNGTLPGAFVLNGKRLVSRRRLEHFLETGTDPGFATEEAENFAMGRARTSDRSNPDHKPAPGNSAP